MRFMANLKLTFPKDGTKTIAEGVLELAQVSDAKWSRERQEPSPLEQFLDEPEVAMPDAEPAPVEDGPVADPLAGVDVQEAEAELPLSIQEQVARAMAGDPPQIEQAEEGENPFDTKRL